MSERYGVTSSADRVEPAERALCPWTGTYIKSRPCLESRERVALEIPARVARSESLYTKRKLELFSTIGVCYKSASFSRRENSFPKLRSQFVSNCISPTPDLRSPVVNFPPTPGVFFEAVARPPNRRDSSRTGKSCALAESFSIPRGSSWPAQKREPGLTINLTAGREEEEGNVSTTQDSCKFPNELRDGRPMRNSPRKPHYGK